MLIILSNFSGLTYRPMPWFFSGVPLPCRLNHMAGHQKQFTRRPGPERCGFSSLAHTEEHWWKDNGQGSSEDSRALSHASSKYMSTSEVFSLHSCPLWCHITITYSLSAHLAFSHRLHYICWLVTCLFNHIRNFPRRELYISRHPR